MNAVLSICVDVKPTTTSILQTYHSEVKTCLLTNKYRDMARAAEHPLHL